MKADLSELTPIVERVVRASPLSVRVKAIALEAGEDLDGVEFIRVMLSVTDPDGLKWHQIAPTVREIEDAVGDYDDRFPSIRFAEAA